MMYKEGLKVISPHISEGYPAYNMLLYCAVIDNPGHYHEYKDYKLVENHAEGGLAVKDGRIHIPRGIGLGLDLAFVNKPDGQIIFEDTA